MIIPKHSSDYALTCRQTSGGLLAPKDKGPAPQPGLICHCIPPPSLGFSHLTPLPISSKVNLTTNSSSAPSFECPSSLFSSTYLSFKTPIHGSGAASPLPVKSLKLGLMSPQISSVLLTGESRRASQDELRSLGSSKVLKRVRSELEHTEGSFCRGRGGETGGRETKRTVRIGSRKTMETSSRKVAVRMERNDAWRCI